MGAKAVVRVAGAKATPLDRMIEEEYTEAGTAAAMGVELESRDGTMPIGTMPLHSAPSACSVGHWQPPPSASASGSSWKDHVQFLSDHVGGSGTSRAGKHWTVSRGRFELSELLSVGIGGPIPCSRNGLGVAGQSHEMCKSSQEIVEGLPTQSPASSSSSSIYQIPNTEYMAYRL